MLSCNRWLQVKNPRGSAERWCRDGGGGVHTGRNSHQPLGAVLGFELWWVVGCIWLLGNKLHYEHSSILTFAFPATNAPQSR